MIVVIVVLVVWLLVGGVVAVGVGRAFARADRDSAAKAAARYEAERRKHG